MVFPQRFGSPTVTLANKLRCLFVSSADITEMSASMAIVCRLYFDFIPAPKSHITKFGKTGNM